MNKNGVRSHFIIRKFAGFLVCVCLLLLNHISFAQEKPDQPKPPAENISQTVSEATNPLAFITKWQIQPNFSFIDEGARKLTLINRIVQPTQFILLPFIKSKDPRKVYTIYRIEIPIVGQTFPEAKKELDVTGLSDLTLFDLLTFSKSWGLFGIGPTFGIPLASSELTGTGKWTAGPAFIVIYTKIKSWQMGALGQQFYSFAGDKNRSEQNYMLFQPVCNKVLHNGYYLQFAPIMKFNWERGIYTAPVNLLLGKAFAKNIIVSLGPDVVLTGPAKGDLTIRMNVNLLFAPKGQVKSSLTF